MVNYKTFFYKVCFLFIIVHSFTYTHAPQIWMLDLPGLCVIV